MPETGDARNVTSDRISSPSSATRCSQPVSPPASSARASSQLRSPMAYLLVRHSSYIVRPAGVRVAVLPRHDHVDDAVRVVPVEHLLRRAPVWEPAKPE